MMFYNTDPSLRRAGLCLIFAWTGFAVEQWQSPMSPWSIFCNLNSQWTDESGNTYLRTYLCRYVHMYISTYIDLAISVPQITLVKWFDLRCQSQRFVKENYWIAAGCHFHLKSPRYNNSNRLSRFLVDTVKPPSMVIKLPLWHDPYILHFHDTFFL